MADPDLAHRQAVGRALESRGFRVELCGDGMSTLSAAFRLRPKAVVLEVHLGDTSGYEVCRSLRDELGEGLGILFVSSSRTQPSDRVAGLLLGADDYLAKPVSVDELIARVHAILRRLGFLEHSRRAQGDLTGRELEVLQLLAEGLDQPTIAARLFISSATVAKHIEHILQKLPAHSRAEAVAIAYRRGIGPVPAAAPAGTTIQR